MPPSTAAETGRGAAADERWVGVMAALVLTVLSAGVVSSALLERSTSTPDALTARSAVELDRVVVTSVSVEAQVVAAPAPAPPPVDEPAPEQPAGAAPSSSASAAAPATAPAAPAAPAQAPAGPAAAPAEPAPAAVDPLCGGDGWEQRRGEAALGTLRRPSDSSPFRISYEPGRSDVIGLATVHEGRMQVFVRSCDRLSRSLLAHVVAHELGHLVDGARMNGDLRAQWLAARGIPADTPWYGCNGCADFATPAGDFAEVYAQWQTGASGNRSQLAPAPSQGELADLAARFF